MPAKSETSNSAEEMFDRALDLAERHLKAAVTEGGDIGPYIAVAMIEAAVNQAVDDTSPEDVVEMLRDLANQIEADADDDLED